MPTATTHGVIVAKGEARGRAMRVRHLTTGLIGSVFAIVGSHWIITWEDGTSSDETSDTVEVI